MGYLANEAAGRDKLVFKFDDVRYAAPNIEVELTVTANGTPVETMDGVLKYIKYGDLAKAPYCWSTGIRAAASSWATPTRRPSSPATRLTSPSAKARAAAASCAAKRWVTR